MVAVLLAKVREERVTSAAVICAIEKGINVLRTKTALNVCISPAYIQCHSRSASEGRLISYYCSFIIETLDEQYGVQHAQYSNCRHKQNQIMNG